MAKQTNIDFRRLRSQLIGSRLLWIEIPPCTIDLLNDCYIFEEAQGDSNNGIAKRAQVKLYFDKENKRFELVFELNRTIYILADNSSEILYNLTYTSDSDLYVRSAKQTGNIRPTSFISKLNFQVSELELWNSKLNMINIYSEFENTLGNIIILNSVDGQNVILEGYESDDQENCLKLRVTKSESENVRLEKLNNWERLNIKS